MKVYIIAWEDRTGGNGIDSVLTSAIDAESRAIKMAQSCLREGDEITVDNTKHPDGQVMAVNYGEGNDITVWCKELEVYNENN